MSQLAVFNEFILAKTAITSNITITTDASNIYISSFNFPTTLLTPTNIALVATSLGPVLGIKGLVGGTNIGLLSSNTTIMINLTAVSLTSLGAATLVGTSAGAALSIRGLVAGSFVTITSSDTTLTIAKNSRVLEYGKFVISAAVYTLTLGATATEMLIPFNKMNSDSTTSIVNTPQNYRVYNNSGSTRVFKVDMDISVDSESIPRTFGLLAQGETSVGNNYFYYVSGPGGASSVTRNVHVSRNITLINSQYVSMWGYDGIGTSARNYITGTSITLHTID